MADEGIKKARVLNAQLPPILSKLEGHLVRYRIKSSDQNRTSHWSPFILLQPNYLFLKKTIDHTNSNQIFNIVWDSVIVLKPYETFNTITNKALTDDIATITTSSAHYMKIGDYVTISNIDSTFNGTHVITAISTSPSHTFSFYKQNTNVASSSTSGNYTKNYFIKNANDYDIWIRWDKNDGGDWIYKGRIQNTSISLPHQTTYTINGAVQSSAPNKFSIEVYIPGNPASRGNGVPGDSGSPYLKVYQLLNQTV